MNSALPRIVHCVAAEAPSSLISGVFPIAATIPSAACMANPLLPSEAAKLEHFTPKWKPALSLKWGSHRVGKTRATCKKVEHARPRARHAPRREESSILRDERRRPSERIAERNDH